MSTSSIAWLDFSDEDRRKVMEVVSLFKERDTRDELGLGSIRDAFADLLFPGTSTIQTRARYLLFVPWLYLGYERRGLSSDKVARYLRRDETRLIGALKAAGETEGVIGRISGASLQRFPSSIYWNGLQRWGVLRFPGSQSQYHRLFGVLAGLQRGGRAIDEWELLDEDMLTTWDPNLPDPPDDFPAQANLSLRPEDAAYLRERLLLNCSDSLLAYLVDRCASVDDVDFAWLHPQAAEFPARLREWLIHARNFSEAMYGAALLYNLMLAELCENDDLIAVYRDEMGKWRGRLVVRDVALKNWDRSAFWTLVTDTGRIPVLTQAFVNDWLDLLLSGPSILHLAEHKEARRLVREREVWLKRSRSRFESPRHLELWSGAAGVYQLDYHWFVARRITNDILHGLGVN
jgi:hypothetical protein